MPTTPLAIVVAGTIATVPRQGGWTWAILQYLLGLRRLGHRVVFIDPVSLAALRPSGAGLRASTNAEYFSAVVRRFDLDDIATLLAGDGGRETIGLDYGELMRVVGESDLLINVSGVLRDQNVLGAARRRVYLDLDPGFTQLWHAVQGIDMGLMHHTDFVTIGRALGTQGCAVPTCGVAWIPSWQPIVLEHWPVRPGGADGPITTVANWRGYGSVEFGGVTYGQKVHAWRPLMELPTRSHERFDMALAIDPGETADLQALARNRWTLINPATVASTPDDYQAFVQSSKAELGIAKTGYIVSRTGWLSDRSLCYLATGRPVLAQDTGFGAYLPATDGLLAFATLDEAADAIDRMNADYSAHRVAARALAEEHFDSDKVLTLLLDRLSASPQATATASPGDTV